MTENPLLQGSRPATAIPVTSPLALFPLPRLRYKPIAGGLQSADQPLWRKQTVEELSPLLEQAVEELVHARESDVSNSSQGQTTHLSTQFCIALNQTEAILRDLALVRQPEDDDPLFNSSQNIQIVRIKTGAELAIEHCAPDGGADLDQSVMLSGATLEKIKLAETEEVPHIVSVVMMQMHLANMSVAVDDSNELGVTRTTKAVPSAPVVIIAAYDRATGEQLQAGVTYALNEHFAQADESAIRAVSNNNNDWARVLSARYECGFYDLQGKVFSTRGCVRSRASDELSVSCSCNHTTAFTIMLSIERFVLPGWIKKTATATEAISVVFLVVTLAIFATCKGRIRSGDRRVIQMSLCSALLGLHVTSLLHDLALLHHVTCEIATVVAHYFLLATGAWMVADGVNILLKTSPWALRRNNPPSRALRMYPVLGWGLPAVVVASTATVGFLRETYMDALDVRPRMYARCWVSGRRGAWQGAVLAPMVAVVAVNTAVALKMAAFVYRMSKQTETFLPSDAVKRNRDHVIASIKAFAVLLPSLGLAWIFGLLSGLTDSCRFSTVFAALHAVVNGLQGVFLFAVYCVYASNVRHILVSRFSPSRSSMTLPSNKTGGGPNDSCNGR